MRRDVISAAYRRGLGSYVVNLDPAVTHFPVTANIDIRDTVNYKEARARDGTAGPRVAHPSPSPPPHR